jgi:streptogramin lyase
MKTKLLVAVVALFCAHLASAQTYTFSTIAGQTGRFGSADGIGSAARFGFGAFDVATDNLGNLYVADSGNNTIRKITPDGTVTTLAGDSDPFSRGGVDGTGSAARFDSPDGLTVDSAGNVYVADSSSTIRKITPAGVVTTLAGLAYATGSADGTGSAARFFLPRDVVVDADGNLFVTDSGNFTIRKITPAGVVTTVAGSVALLAAPMAPVAPRAFPVSGHLRWITRAIFLSSTLATPRSAKSLPPAL